MKRKISRRAFLGGSAAVTSTLMLGGCEKIYRIFSPESAQTAAHTVNGTYYPPALLGLRGDSEGVQAAAHSVALKKQTYTLPGKADEQYDLVIVGAGISGLTAAYLYQKQRPEAKILLIDNHDDFGGHAQRNEFTVGGRLLISYAGSESIDSPESEYSEESLALLKDLGVDYKKFETYFHQDLYEKTRGLKKGVFFNKASFGKDTVIAALPEAGEEEAAEIISRFPLADADKEALAALYTDPADYLKGQNKRRRAQTAEETNYYDFLKNYAKLPEGALKYLKNISSEYWGHAINAISVQEAFEEGYPGLDNLGLKAEEEGEEEPYIYHFPDGNASIARLLVRKMIPASAPGSTMEDIVLAKFDYSKLDAPENNVRIRLNSTALLVENNDGGVAVAYMPHGGGNLKQVQAKQAVFAGHSALAARVIPQMPEAQKAAALTNVKVQSGRKKHPCIPKTRCVFTLRSRCALLPDPARRSGQHGRLPKPAHPRRARRYPHGAHRHRLCRKNRPRHVPQRPPPPERPRLQSAGNRNARSIARHLRSSGRKPRRRAGRRYPQPLGTRLQL